MSKRIIEPAEQGDLDVLAGVTPIVHTTAAGVPLRGPLTRAERGRIAAGEVLPNVSASYAHDALDESGKPTGSLRVVIEEETAAKLESDAEVTRLGLDAQKVSSLRLRMSAVDIS